jgi:hypothetical protein
MSLANFPNPPSHPSLQVASSTGDATGVGQALYNQLYQQLSSEMKAMHPLSSPTANHNPVIRPPQPRIEPPPAYEGKGTGLDEWLSTLRRQFGWYHATINTDTARIQFAVSHFKEPPGIGGKLLDR